MPIYEYCCTSCANKFDLLRSFSQVDEPAECPECHNESRKLVSNFASFAKDSSGITAPVGGGSSCSGCAASSCASCHN